MRLSELEISRKYQCRKTGKIAVVLDIVEGIQTNVVYGFCDGEYKCSVSRFIKEWTPC